MMYFTFQYVQINTLKMLIFLLGLSSFTFQYVQINTLLGLLRVERGLIFTFQYVQINTCFAALVDFFELPLHSNMFRLIRSRRVSGTPRL